jgi:transcriptional regulator with XRE-family HTH domain
MIEEEECEVDKAARQRVVELLRLLAQKGLKQQEIAGQAGLPVQYLSDIKKGRRRVTELVARRLGQAFQVNFQWLTGSSDALEPQSPGVTLAAVSPGGGFWLPMHPHPVEGEPRLLPSWDGSGTEVSGAALAKLAQARWPYVLVFGHDDIDKRLRKGDRVLISQSVSQNAEISVVKRGKKLFLARPQADGTWRRAANGDSLEASCPAVGHCLAIIWSPLGSG